MGLIFFGMRAVLGLGACCPFLTMFWLLPPWEGNVQMLRFTAHAGSQEGGGRGSLLSRISGRSHPLPGKLALDYRALSGGSCVSSQEGGGSDLSRWPAPAHRQQQQQSVLSLGLAPGAHAGAICCLWAWRKKLLLWADSCPRMLPNNDPLSVWQAQASCWTPSGVMHCTLSPSGSLHTTPILSPGCDHWSLSLSTQPSPTPVGKWTAILAGECQLALTLIEGLSQLCPQYTCCCPVLQGSEALSVPASEGTSQCAETFPLSQLPPRGTRPIQIPFSFFCSFFFCHAQLHGGFLPFWKSEACQRSVEVVWELFHMWMYFWCIYGERVSSTSYSSTILI